MKRCWIIVVLCLLPAAVRAATRADSILSLTGNLRTKLVWVRWPWCDENYNPVQAFKAETNENANPHTQLMTFDTDQGGIRFIDSTIGSHCYPRLTRRDGSHVIWNDNVNTCAWIRDLSGSSPRRKLIDGGDYNVAACHYNPATNTEMVYVISADGKALYRIPLKTDYTLDLTQKTSIYRGSGTIAAQLSSSEDGLYFGVQIPWPSCQILNITSGELLGRRADGAFGCQPNIASDKTYRFFHLRDDHRIIRMWDPALGTTNWDVVINQGMPGNQTNHDCAMPRWSNNPRFFTNAYPLITGFVPHWGPPAVFGMSAAQIKAADPSDAGTFCLGKLSQDFKSVEKYVLISGLDARYRDVNGDAWIAGSSDGTPPAAPGNPRGTAESESKIRLTWNAAVDNESGIIEYNVFRGTTRIAITAGTATSFTDSLLRENTDYTYQVSGVNAANLESPTSAPVTVRTSSDTRPPTILSATALGNATEVTVLFSEAVISATATTAGNYAVSGSVAVSGAALSGGGMVVTLTLGAALTAGTPYTLTVNNVRDTAATPNTIAANSTANFTFFPCGDDFSSAALDATRWSVVDAYGGKGLVKQENGGLYIRADASADISRNTFMGVRRGDITGNFDVWVKIINSNVAPTATQQGIIAANNITQLSQGGYVTVGLEYYNDKTTTALPADAAYIFRYNGKGTVGSLDSRIESRVNVALPCWLRLVRNGTTFSAYSSIAGPWGWTPIGSAQPLSTGTNSQIGLFSSMNGCAQTWGSHALFDEFGCTIGGLGSLPTGFPERNRVVEVKAGSPIFPRAGEVEAMFPTGVEGSVSVLDAAGRTVARARGVGRIVCRIDRQPAGVYVVRAVGKGVSPVYRTLVRQ